MEATGTIPEGTAPPPARAADGASLAAPRDDGRQRVRERRRRVGRRVRRGLVALGLLAATAAVVFALRPSPVPVDVATVASGALEVAVEESGKTRVKDRFVLSAPVTGNMARLPLEPGDAVDEGDTLVEIVPAQSPLLDQRARTEAEARLGAAVSALGQARAQGTRADAAQELAAQELARIEKLAEKGAATRQALDQARFEAQMRAGEQASARFAAKVASEEVRLARATLGLGGGRGRDQHVDVLAPVSGRVLRVTQKNAGVVQAGTPLLELGDPAALEVVVDLLTTDAVHVRSGTRARIEGWGGGEPLAGRVRFVEPSAFTRQSALGVDEQRVNVIIALTDPRERWASLGDGYRVEVRLVLWRSDAVLQVPQGAVFRRGDGWAVFRVDGGVARLAPVVIGHRGETSVEVRSGLDPGATVAVHPGDRVKDGARVQVR